MKLIVKYLLLVGAALCVTPIFSSVQAQQGSNEARMLLQMQEMQAEIAALRDMVERQQYQLQRMQRNIQVAEQSRTVNSAPSLNQAATNIPDSAESDTLASDEKWLLNSSANSSTSSPAQSEANASEQTVDMPVSPEANDDGFYQSEPLPVQVPGNASDTYTARDTNNVDGTNSYVEERVITAPPLSQTATESYPPVEDRSVGGARGAVNQQVAERTSQARVPVNSIPSGAQLPGGAIDARQLPSEPMIAIPDLSNPQPAAEDIQNANKWAVEAAQGSNPGALSEREYYQQGFDLVKQSKFKDAIQMFQQLIDNHPNGSLRADAYYWIGEAGFLDRDLVTSKRYFRTFMDNYPQSARIPGAMLRTAYIEQEQGNLIEARILLNEIIQYHPSSDAVHAAKNRLADLETKVN